MTVSVFTPYLTATLNGSAINTLNLKGARVETSFSDPVSRGYIKCLDEEAYSDEDPATITMGAGANNVTRFPNGSVLQGDWLNSGPNFELVLRGPMLAVQKYRNNRPHGLTLQDLTGGPAPDEDIARAVLDVVGVSYSGGNIGGTGIVRGASAPDGYTWRKGQTALEFLTDLSKASIGYKLVESAGDIYRVQVLASPGGSADFTFTEGVDIFEGAHFTSSAFEKYGAWEVTGFDYGDGLGAVTFRYPDPSPAVPVMGLSSTMIERDSDSDSRSGISCETVLNYLRGESDHAILKLSGLTTPRDDLFGPGQLHQINSAMLGGSRLMTCVGVTTEVDDTWFVQTLEYVG